MGTGPRAESGFDLALTEILEGEHRLLVEVGSARGAEVLAELRSRLPATDADAARRQAVDGAAQRMGRRMDARDLRDLLAENLEHPRWDDVADALPHLRQLRAGVPDLLLHDRRGPRRTSPASTPSAGAHGTRVSRSTTPISTAAASVRATARDTGNG